jgi:putative oxidoreductase
MKYVLLLGRSLFSLLFFLKAFEHFSDSGMQHAISMEIPMPSLLVPVAGVILLLGALSILLGYKARLGAWCLIIFLVPTSIMMHQFWNMVDSYESMMEHMCFFKNIALIGSLLMLVYFGSGPLSLDRRI